MTKTETVSNRRELVELEGFAEGDTVYVEGERSFYEYRRYPASEALKDVTNLERGLRQDSALRPVMTYRQFDPNSSDMGQWVRTHHTSRSIVSTPNAAVILNALDANTTAVGSWVQWSPEPSDPQERGVPTCRGVAKRRIKERARAKAARQARKRR